MSTNSNNGQTNYKPTLNLPVTAFPMKANLAQQEPHRLQRWLQTDYYGQIRSARHDRPLFIVHDGPPYANGDIHVGHALGSILKDIVNKSKILSGWNVAYVPGWDCHGLPIEHKVEKREKKSDPERFRKACREYAASQMARQKKDFIRLGTLADWDGSYWTADPVYEADTIRALATIFQNGYAERRDKPVHWCLDCRSSLAEAEVEYAPKESWSIDVGFPVPATERLRWAQALGYSSDSLPSQLVVLIWTTTPWTLPANEAIALASEVEYGLFADPGNPERAYLAAMPLADAVHHRLGGEPVAATCAPLGTPVLGRRLSGLYVQHPFLDKTVPIVLGAHVTVDTGTGAVHTAPAHGEEDYTVALAAGLPVRHAVGPGGVFDAAAPFVGGLHLNDAQLRIIEVLKEAGNLFSQSRITHNYLHCWRHKTPVISRSTPQWFIRVKDLRERALKAVETVNWVPESGYNRIRAMIANAPDWCISRQRHWCVPIPVFLHRQTGKLHPDTVHMMQQVADAVEKKGLEAWFDPHLHQQLLGEAYSDYEPGTDGLDVWFDSGVSHWAVLRRNPELRYPADMYFEGSDQHRGWFQSALMTAMALQLPVAPYQQVLTHGFVVDADGRKMSKSLGNVVAPQTVVSQYGADVLRWWVAATDFRLDVHISEEILRRMVDSYRRVRNTARFLLANLHDFDPVQHGLPPLEWLALDREIVRQAWALQDAILQHYDCYEFHLVCQKIQHFCTQDLGAFYLDIIKDRQYTVATDGLARRSAQNAMYHLLEMLVRWLAPILSFTADEIWEYMPGKRETACVFAAHWWRPIAPSQWGDKNTDRINWQTVRDTVAGVRLLLETMRKTGAIGSSLDAELDCYALPEKLGAYALLGEEWRFVCLTSRATWHAVSDSEQVPEDALSVLPGVWLRATVSAHEKCARCWHRVPDVDRNPTYPGVCARCCTNISDPEGESRVVA